MALPLYQGIMFYDRLPNVAQHIRGSGRQAEWGKGCDPNSPIQPQFLIAGEEYYKNNKVFLHGTKIGIRSLSNATNERTVIAGAISNLPAGNSVNYLTPKSTHLRPKWFAILSSIVFDWQARMRISGTNMNLHFFEEMGVPIPHLCDTLQILCSVGLGLSSTVQSASQLEWGATVLPIAASERMRCKVIADAIVAFVFGLSSDDLSHVLADCDLGNPRGRPTGFWRVDRDRAPELRHTVLTQVAFRDLETKIADAGGDGERGMGEFFSQNNGHGWMIPESLRLADYGLGDDERAERWCPVAKRIGPRFLDWQLSQTADESWHECHLHVRNLRGSHEYAMRLVRLIDYRLGRGERCLDILTDKFVHRLLGDAGAMTALRGIRAGTAADSAVYTTIVNDLRVDGVVSEADCRLLLEAHEDCVPRGAEGKVHHDAKSAVDDEQADLFQIDEDKQSDSHAQRV